MTRRDEGFGRSEFHLFLLVRWSMMSTFFTHTDGNLTLKIRKLKSVRLKLQNLKFASKNWNFISTKVRISYKVIKADEKRKNLTAESIKCR